MNVRTKKGKARLFLGAVRRTFAGSACKSVLDIDDQRVNYYNNIATQSVATEEVEAAISSVEIEREPKEEEVATEEEMAATKIQAYFRGHLARRACRALRSIVKVQAAVRGMCVRKESRMALHCMQALVKLQVRVRARQLLGRSGVKEGL